MTETIINAPYTAVSESSEVQPPDGQHDALMVSDKCEVPSHLPFNSPTKDYHETLGWLREVVTTDSNHSRDELPDDSNELTKPQLLNDAFEIRGRINRSKSEERTHSR